MALSRLRKVAYVVGNAWALLLLLMTAAFLFSGGWWVLGLLVLLACVDQVDDIYYSLYKRHIYPEKTIGKTLNTIFELIAVIAAAIVVLAVLPYLVFYPTWWWFTCFVVALYVLITNLYDVSRYRTAKLVEVMKSEYLKRR